MLFFVFVYLLVLKYKLFIICGVESALHTPFCWLIEFQSPFCVHSITTTSPSQSHLNTDIVCRPLTEVVVQHLIGGRRWKKRTRTCNMISVSIHYLKVHLILPTYYKCPLIFTPLYGHIIHDISLKTYYECIIPGSNIGMRRQLYSVLGHVS